MLSVGKILLELRFSGKIGWMVKSLHLQKLSLGIGFLIIFDVVEESSYKLLQNLHRTVELGVMNDD